MMESHDISASWGGLLRQASMTADQFLDAALRRIDEEKARLTPAERLDFALRLAAIAERDFYTSSLGVAAQKIDDAIRSIGPALVEAAAATRE